jgi:hypothetical protein
LKLIWTRSSLLSDKNDPITWAFGHRCGHFAVSFFDETIFYHSNYKGVHVNEYYEFYSSRIKVYEIYIPTEYDEEVQILQAMIDLYGDLSYDWKFFFWLTWHGVKKKLFGITPPKYVGYEDSGAIICHEVLNLLPDDIRPDIDLKASVMPETMYLMVKDAMNGV